MKPIQKAPLLSQLAILASAMSVVTMAAAQQPKPQPQTGLQATDSAVLWMVEQFDATTAVESSISSLAWPASSGRANCGICQMT